MSAMSISARLSSSSSCGGPSKSISTGKPPTCSWFTSSIAHTKWRTQGKVRIIWSPGSFLGSQCWIHVFGKHHWKPVTDLLETLVAGWSSWLGSLFKFFAAKLARSMSIWRAGVARQQRHCCIVWMGLLRLGLAVCVSFFQNKVSLVVEKGTLFKGSGAKIAKTGPKLVLFKANTVTVYFLQKQTKQKKHQVSTL